MSHVAIVDIEIKDFEALARACETLGLRFNEGQKNYKWYGRSTGAIPPGFKASDLGKCEHAISIPGNSRAYEIGVCKSRDGTDSHMLMWDFWSGGFGLQELVGNNCDKLNHEYAKEVARGQVAALASADNWTVHEEFDEATGETVIRLRQY